jgi:two-component system, chemotaxis family, protein-glutamate methylesterase/glutaminase
MAIRVVLADDSAFMRKVLTDILSSDPDIEVVATAHDGEEAVRRVKELHPDVVTLDIEMPKMNGLEALKAIMTDCPTPVIMVSATTYEGARETLKCLEYGAFDFIQKAGGKSISLNMFEIGTSLIQKVKAAANVSGGSLRKLSGFDQSPVRLKVPPLAGKYAVVIGSSSGGPPTLAKLVPMIPAGLPAPILFVQHMPAGFTKSFAERLDQLAQFRVKEAQEGDVLESGRGYLAPGGFHMEVHRKDNAGQMREVVHLNEDPPVNFVRPAVDVTMFSVAEVYGKNTIGVILTGMGSDGAQGMQFIKSQGGRTIAQDKETSLIYGMPKAVADLGAADEIAPLGEIADKIVRMLT